MIQHPKKEKRCRETKMEEQDEIDQLIEQWRGKYAFTSEEKEEGDDERPRTTHVRHDEEASSKRKREQEPTTKKQRTEEEPGNAQTEIRNNREKEH